MERQINITALKEIFEGMAYEVHEYSGRGMFGARCLAVTCDNPSGWIAEVFLYLAENNTPYSEIIQVAEILKDSRTDSMGRASVVYWPNLIIS